MSRHHLNPETIQLDLRSSPSQHHLNPSRSSSLPSQSEEDQQQQQQQQQHRSNSNTMANLRDEKAHKLDLYSIPVFLLEVLVLTGLTYFAYTLHFSPPLGENGRESYSDALEYMNLGFYCDDIAYRQQYNPDSVKAFTIKDSELAIVIALFAIPVALIVLCELINSMFGALKFRQIRALCKCCKLHSITRRAFRFSGAYLLGLLIVMILCDILAHKIGRLRPYFAQECPSAYEQCLRHAPASLSSSPLPNGAAPSTFSQFQPLVAPISGDPSNQTTLTSGLSKRDLNQQQARSDSARIRQLSSLSVAVRQWVDLTGLNLTQVCRFNPQAGVLDPDIAVYRFNQLFLSWPSYPAAVFNYAILFLSAYLSFVGTARPFRLITCVIITALMLIGLLFDALLVKEHHNHWEDVASSAVLSFIVVVFVILVYLNKFRDTHYYENQKLFNSSGQRSADFLRESDSFRGYTNGDGSFGQYGTDKINTNVTSMANNGVVVQNDENGIRSASTNDLAMRYFQIPRANYRGAPRPLSSLNQMR